LAAFIASCREQPPVELFLCAWFVTFIFLPATAVFAAPNSTNTSDVTLSLPIAGLRPLAAAGRRSVVDDFAVSVFPILIFMSIPLHGRHLAAF
jgi:hypothetical protein